MDFNKQLAKKFFDGTASSEEADKVLNWFQTPEGQSFLEDQLDEDVNRIEKFSLDSPNERSSLNRIHSRINRSNVYALNRKKTGRHSSVWAVAASIVFLVASLSYLQFFYGNGLNENKPENVQTVYSTDAQIQRLITLSDGTRIRLNENSTLKIASPYNIDSRKVTLDGQAFFEVASDSLRPFIVDANGAEVRVLGTAFTVTSSPDAENIIVAVSEGRVGMGPAGENASNKVLEKNMVGLFDTATREVTVENMNVTNYLSWMHGRVVFDRTPFMLVLKQLNHIYGIDYEIRDNELRDIRLTADFYEGSLDNVINTIAHSLGIEAEREGNLVKWRYPE